MHTYDQVAQRWLDIALGRTNKARLTTDRVIPRGDSIFSYGDHFELARVLRGRTGKPTAILLNGDRYSNSTTNHQSTVRCVAQKSGLPNVILPFTALNAAGVDRASVRLVHVTPDRHETTTHVSDTEPPELVWETHDVEEYVELSADRLQELADETNAKAVAEWEQRRCWAEKDTDGYWSQWLRDNPTPPLPFFTPDDVPHWQRCHRVKTGTRQVAKLNGNKYAPWVEIETLPDGSTRYAWETYRHWLGASVIRAAVTWTSWTRCRTCKGTGSVDGSEEFRSRCHGCRGAGGHQRTHRRWSYYLSAFDIEETHPLYFFCELPKGARPKTVDEAFESLKPQAVRLAEQIGRPVTRQGDVFAISMRSVDKRGLRSKGATFARKGGLLGTNHEATEVAYMPDGTTFARGVLHHNPADRPPDHRRRRLAPGWHLILKNTVPVAV